MCRGGKRESSLKQKQRSAGFARVKIMTTTTTTTRLLVVQKAFVFFQILREIEREKIFSHISFFFCFFLVSRSRVVVDVSMR